MQHGYDTGATSVVLTHPDGKEVAVLLLCAGDPEAHEGLSRVFSLHDAPMVDLKETAPDPARDVGDCVIRDDGVLMTIRGTGRLLGVNMNLTWGFTSRSWRRVAMAEGCVWVGLIGMEDYRRVVTPGLVEEIPVLPVLKLETLLK